MTALKEFIVDSALKSLKISKDFSNDFDKWLMLYKSAVKISVDHDRKEQMLCWKCGKKFSRDCDICLAVKKASRSAKYQIPYYAKKRRKK